MNHQKNFVDMMAALIGKKIRPEDAIALSKAELKQSCATLSDESGTPLKIDMDSGCEPCPFCCSGVDKPFEFVWVGLNPGSVLKSWRDLNFSWQTTWQELTDFCVPSDIRADKNIYQLLKANGVASEYYRFFLRVHTALAGGKIFNTWDEFRREHADVEKYFVELFAAHPILNADLIPYKSDETTFSAKNLLDDANYGNYFRQLIRLIENETAPDAWIIFFGNPPEVVKLLNKFTPDWNVSDANLHLRADEDKRLNHFHFFARGQQKILLSPFLQSGRSSIYNRLDVLIDALKKL